MESSLSGEIFYIRSKHATTLFQFIKSNKEEQFIEYISALKVDEIDVNIKDDNGNYMIFFAIMMNNRRILRKVIEYGAKLDVLDAEGYSVLYYPIKFNYLELFSTFLEYNKNIIGASLVNLKDTRGSVPLFYAIKYRNRYALQELLVNGADVNYKNSKNVNSLHMAVFKKDPTLVRMLMKYTKNIDAVTSQGSTALHYACNLQLDEIVMILLDNGAKQNIVEYGYDFYPIFYSVVQNNVTISKILIDTGADPNWQDYLGNTILHYCISNDHFEIFSYVLKKIPVRKQNDTTYIEDINESTDAKINIDTKNDTDLSELPVEMKTIGEKSEMLVLVSPNRYIDPNIVNSDGLTVMHLLLYSYNEKYDESIRKLLPETNLNYQDNQGNTILHILSEQLEHFERFEQNLWKKFYKLLSVKKMNIYIRNNENKTVFDMVPTMDKEKFLKIITKSYYNYLTKYENDWLVDWQNKCSVKNLSQIQKNECYTLIHDAIINEKISIPLKKNKTIITVIENEPVEISTFTGSLLDMLVGFKYLTKKYSNTTSIFNSNRETEEKFKKYTEVLGIEENINQHVVNFEIRWIYQKIFFPLNFEENLKKIIMSKKFRFVIIPIGIILSNGNHSNGLLLDIDKNIIERFEPHGYGYPVHFNYNPELLDEILRKKITIILTTIYKKKVSPTYFSPKEYLPKIGFQSFDNSEISTNKNIGDPDGFCTLWTIWFFDYRLKYYEIEPWKIVRSLIKQIRLNKYSFRTIMRNYSKKITDLRDTYLKEINRNVNDYINSRLTQPDLDLLLKIILSDNNAI